MPMVTIRTLLCTSITAPRLIYRNFNFRRDKPELLENIGRKKLRNMARARKAQSPVTSASEQGPSPKKVKLLPTRRSPRLHKTEEDDVMSQQEVPNKTPADKVSSVPSSALEKSQRPCNDPYNCPPQETSGQCGEGTSDKDTVLPLAAVKVEGVGHEPSSSSGYEGCDYMSSVYNNCSSVLMAALAAIILGVSAEEEYEQEQNEEEEGEEEERKEEDEEYSENTYPDSYALNEEENSKVKKDMVCTKSKSSNYQSPNFVYHTSMKVVPELYKANENEGSDNRQVTGTMKLNLET
ncbi:hypothetical protein A6R68_04392, partial [Neotoma lepida]